MTQQLSDIVEFGGDQYGLAETDGAWPEFDPKAHGLPPTFVGSHCWRGYFRTYRVDDRLVLDAVAVAWSEVYERSGGPPLFGRRARRVRRCHDDWARYEDLQQPIDFTGSLLVGQGVRPDSGLTPPSYTYVTLVELVFAGGRLAAWTDVTAEAERHRAAWDAYMFGPKKHQPDEALVEFSEMRRAMQRHSRFFESRRREASEPP